MAKMRNSNPKSTSGGYNRMLGNDKLAEVFTKAQSTVISNGSELEKIITNKSNTIGDLDDFMNKVNSGNINNGVYLCPKKIIKDSSFKLFKHEPDFLIFKISNTGKVAYVIELKDGDNFDTKKSSGEKQSLERFKSHLGEKTEFRTDYRLCAFNQSDNQKIVEGFKNTFDINHVWTGREFCDLLGIDYLAIINQRLIDSKDNFDYFIEQISDIEEVREALERKFNVTLENNDN